MEILGKVPDKFLLKEPSIVYQEVYGKLARNAGKAVADKAKEQMDIMIHPSFLSNCDKAFCTSAHPLCAEYNIRTIDAIYLNVALDKSAVLVSLDKEDFVDGINSKIVPIESYHVTELPY